MLKTEVKIRDGGYIYFSIFLASYHSILRISTTLLSCLLLVN